MRLLGKGYVKALYIFSDFLCNPALFYSLIYSPPRCARDKHFRCVCRKEGEAIKDLHDVKALGTNSVKCVEEPGTGQDLVSSSIRDKEKHKRTGVLARAETNEVLSKSRSERAFLPLDLLPPTLLLG